MRWAIALLGCAGATGCFGPSFQSGQFVCGEGGTCPPGFDCVAGQCVTDGDEPRVDAAGSETPDARSRPVDANPGSPDAAPATPDATPAPDAPPGLTVVRINVHGPAVTGVDFPGDWAADPGVGGVCNGTESGPGSGEIVGTVDDELFHGGMRDGTELICIVSGLPAGTYTVNMLFGETFVGTGCLSGTGGTGSRVFGIEVNGVIEFSDVDIFALGNGCVADPADADAQPIVLTATTTVGASGMVVLELEPTSGSAILNAIEVIQQQR